MFHFIYLYFDRHIDHFNQKNKTLLYKRKSIVKTMVDR